MSIKIKVVTSTTGTHGVLIKVVPGPKVAGPDRPGKNAGDIRVSSNGSGRGSSSTRTTLTVSIGEMSDADCEQVRCAGGAVARWLHANQASRALIDGETLLGLDLEGATEAFVEGLALGAFRFDRHKSKDRSVKDVSVGLYLKRSSAKLRQSIKRVSIVAKAVNLARELGHEPANVINPATLARRIAQMARASQLKCTVYDDKRLAKMKAGALLAVGVASETPARLIVVEYAGTASGRKQKQKHMQKPVVLVGKAITFDTGGYSLKDKDGIVGMKYDKCGAMAVIGALQAAAELKIKTPVVGIIAAAENMVSGKAYRPNDIITTMSGKTVEIISTDAEGRLVLADALTFAQKHYKPRSIIDLATLTGGVVVALGTVRGGLFANDDKLADELTLAGDRVHERLWRLPLDQDYFELIKGDDSDLKNSAGRWAHPIIGGMFLKQFVDDKVRWAHLDIAGTATCDKDLPYCPKGATGFGVRLLVDYLENL